MTFIIWGVSTVMTVNVKEARLQTHETLTAWGHANGLS
jgi:hypothetical protein